MQQIKKNTEEIKGMQLLDDLVPTLVNLPEPQQYFSQVPKKMKESENKNRSTTQ